MASYKEGCRAVGRELVDISKEWAAFAPPEVVSSTSISVSAVLSSSTRSASEVSSPSKVSTSSEVTTTSLITSAESPRASSLVTSTTSAADLQIPICGVGQS